MIKKILLTLFTILLFFSFNTQVFAYSVPQLNTEHYIVMDADTGEVIIGNNIYEKVYPASITKFLTILTAIKHGNLNDIITTTEFDIDLEEGASTVFLEVDDQITMEDGLYAAGINSGNDISNGIARTTTGSFEEFIALMNNEALLAGATSSNFANPHGLHQDNHYTTPYDISLIMKYALQFEGFTNYLSKISHQTTPVTPDGYNFLLTGHNLTLFPDSEYYVDGIIASKTGYTDEAMFTLITTATRNNKTLIVAVFLEESAQAYYEDTNTLFDYVFDNYKSVSTSSINMNIEEFKLPDNYHFYDDDFYKFDQPTSVYAYNDTTNYPIEANLTFNSLDTSSIKGDIIGSLVYTQNGKTISTTDVYLDSGIYRFNLTDLVMWIVLIILALLLATITSLFIARHIYRKKRRYKRIKK